MNSTDSRAPARRTAGPDRGRVVEVPYLLADQLARLSHFTALDLPEVRELDEVACWLIGRVHCASVVWADLRPVAEHLFRLISDDWDDDDLDDARDGDPILTDDEVEARHTRTVERLRCEIDNVIGFARLRYAELSRSAS